MTNKVHKLFAKVIRQTPDILINEEEIIMWESLSTENLNAKVELIINNDDKFGAVTLAKNIECLISLGSRDEREPLPIAITCECYKMLTKLYTFIQLDDMVEVKQGLKAVK